MLTEKVDTIDEWISIRDNPHKGTNKLPKAECMHLADKVGKALQIAQQAFRNATNHLSVILPKKVDKSIQLNLIQYVFQDVKANSQLLTKRLYN